MKKILFILLAFITSASNLTRAEEKMDLKTSLQQVQQAMIWISHLYVDSVNQEKIAGDAIRGILKELDPHSTFMTPEEAREMTQDLEGNFEGIGIRYQMSNDTLVVINTITGGPSEKSGILASDRIVEVNDTVIAGVNISQKEIKRRLRGPKGSSVHLKIKRQGENDLIPFTLTRDKIPFYSIDASYMISPEIGYIKVSRFAQQTHKEMSEAMEKLQKQGMRHIIIDLQNNGGGYLQTAVSMAGEFLKRNELVVYTEGRNEERKDYKTPVSGSMTEGRVVILIDEHSASASEILSGAIQDLDRGIIVGRRSFGKGLVQRPVPLIGGAMIRLTVSHYYTPSGRCIQKPYEKGKKENYDSDILQRFKNGEFTSADSIHFTDSLLYQTRNGRVVYGGGGIMPDIFVPLDTTKTTPSVRNIIARGTYNKYILDYFVTNSQDLKAKYQTLEQFIDHFEVTEEMINDLKHRAIKDSVKINDDEYARNADNLKLQIKANIANNLFETGAYFRIINDLNEIYRKGVEIISDEKEYKRLLKSTPKK